MRKLAVIFLAGILSLGICITSIYAAEKFAYVDVISVAGEYNKAKDYNKSLEDKANGYDAEIEKKVNEIKGLQEKINLLSEKEKEAKRPEFEEKVKALQDFRRDKEMELRKKDFENSKEVADDIKNAIKNLAEKEGYTLVFDERTLVYHTTGMDVTGKIIEALNKGAKK